MPEKSTVTSFLKKRSSDKIIKYFWDRKSV